jgi:hypothetical protein
VSKFREVLKTTTFIAGLFCEQIRLRAFHPRNISEYLNILPSRPGTTTSLVSDNDEQNLSVPSSANALQSTKKRSGTSNSKPATGKQSAASRGSADTPASATSSVVPKGKKFTAGDVYLIECINNAILSSRQLHSHGIIRYRLDELLSSSPDLQTEFALKRDGLTTTDKGVVIEVQNIFI